VTDYHARLLAKYTEIVGELAEGTATVNVDEDEQQMIAEVFTTAAMSLMLQMQREEQDALAKAVQSHRRSEQP
jgi:hypothetical protein